MKATTILTQGASLPVSVSSRIESYAVLLTADKVAQATKQGGEAGAAEIAQVYQTVAAANTPAAKKIVDEIDSQVFEVIVASQTTASLAEFFKRQLVQNGFYSATVFRIGTGFAVSLGAWKYQDALDNKARFEALPRFNSNYENKSFLETRKPSWKILS